jgi:predicted RNase H-like HicB family nuclease
MLRRIYRCVEICQWQNAAFTLGKTMNYSIESEREDDGRWLAEVTGLPGALAYGTTQEQACAKAEALALRILAERLEQSEAKPQAFSMALAFA